MRRFSCSNILLCFICSALLNIFPLASNGQQTVIINMAPIDGIAITPDNIFNYQVQASAIIPAQVNGTVRYRNSNLSFSYSYHYSFRPGINVLTMDMVHAKWNFSSSALEELFFTHKILPEGTFEYCVTITPDNITKENSTRIFDECIYHRNSDIFLINLIDPENDAKLKEHNPMLSWVANYSFSNELTYRLRIAEIKQGQNQINAVMRNQPIYDEKNLTQNSIVYPIYAKPLEVNQPYAWTVDAYYKGILLGGAETWRFIIPDDTLPPLKKTSRSYVDIKRETGTNQLSALGTLKLKYILDDAKRDYLNLEIINDNNQKMSLIPSKLNAVYGDNRYTLNLADSSNLKHKTNYTLKISTKTKHVYNLHFQYLNPDFLD